MFVEVEARDGFGNIARFCDLKFNKIEKQNSAITTQPLKKLRILRPLSTGENKNILTGQCFKSTKKKFEKLNIGYFPHIHQDKNLVVACNQFKLSKLFNIQTKRIFYQICDDICDGESSSDCDDDRRRHSIDGYQKGSLEKAVLKGRENNVFLKINVTNVKQFSNKTKNDRKI